MRAQQAGISNVVNAGYDLPTSRAAYSMYGSRPWTLPAVGIHPTEAADESIFQMGEIEVLAGQEGVIAIGETGLDYYRERSSRDAQQELFRAHINIARTKNLPLIVHTRNSIDDAIRMLAKEHSRYGVFHCYSGTYEQAERIIEMGFYLGFGGVLTFSKRAREVFKTVPLERVVLETDSPFLAPSSHRGKRNEPSYLREILYAAATIIDRSPEYIERVTDENASELFSINTA
jgi:TatD DNase family protein